MKDREVEILAYLFAEELYIYILKDNQIYEIFSVVKCRYSGGYDYSDITSIKNIDISEAINTCIGFNMTQIVDERELYNSFSDTNIKKIDSMKDTLLSKMIYPEYDNTPECSHGKYVYVKLENHLEKIKRKNRINKLFEEKTL
jgi:hypothetical protein